MFFQFLHFSEVEVFSKPANQDLEFRALGIGWRPIRRFHPRWFVNPSVPFRGRFENRAVRPRVDGDLIKDDAVSSCPVNRLLRRTVFIHREETSAARECVVHACVAHGRYGPGYDPKM